MGRALLGLVRPTRCATFEGKTRKVLHEHICWQEGAAYGGLPVATCASLLDTTPQAIYAIVFGDTYADSGKPRFHVILEARGREAVIQPSYEFNRGVHTRQKRNENLQPWE